MGRVQQSNNSVYLFLFSLTLLKAAILLRLPVSLQKVQVRRKFLMKLNKEGSLYEKNQMLKVSQEGVL